MPDCLEWYKLELRHRLATPPVRYLVNTGIIHGECAVDVVREYDVLRRIVLYLTFISPPEDLFHGAMFCARQRTRTTHCQ